MIKFVKKRIFNMREEYKGIELEQNPQRNLFEMKLGEETAFIKYSQNDDKMFLLHTEVPDSMEGKGAGSALVEKTFRYLENKELKAVALCPFIVAYLKRHPEWERIVER